jgi:hypothetical protein
MDVDITLFDDAARPQPRQQFVFSNDIALRCGKLT